MLTTLRALPAHLYDWARATAGTTSTLDPLRHFPTMNGHRAILLGALSMALTVGLGAFGAHGLEEHLARLETTRTFETAVRYQAWHALGLIALGLFTLDPARAHLARAAGWAFAIGTLCFSGSLYGLALEPSATWLGPVTPIGGVGFLIGWLSLGCAAWKARPASAS